MKKAGKHDKALKLFQHAAALAPRHPDILNHYGEFLEETQNDIVMADQLYFQALTYSPNHLGALANRERTAQIVEEMDRSNLRRIDDKRDTLSNIPDSSSSFRRAKKEAYFQVCLIYVFFFCKKSIKVTYDMEVLSGCVHPYAYLWNQLMLIRYSWVCTKSCQQI